MPTNFEARSKEEISSEINNTKQEIKELNQKLMTQNEDEKKDTQKSINKNAAYLQALEKALNEKESNEQTLARETTAMLGDLKKTRATEQITQGLQAANIEGPLFDESKNPNYDTVKKYLQHLMDKSNNQSSFIQTLNDEGGGCWSSCIQIALNNLGHYKQGEKNHIDGIIGTDTKSATRRFQEDYNQKHNYKEGDENRLKPDSIPGYKTTKALLEELEKTDNSDSVSGTPTGSTTRIESGASNPNNPTATVNHNKTEDEIIEGTIEENKNNSEFNPDVFNALVEEANTVIRDENINIYYSSPYSTNYEAVSTNIDYKNNPYYRPSLILPSNLGSTSININLHDYLTQNNKFDSMKFQKELQEIKSAYSFISQEVRGKIFTYNDIFGNNSSPNIYDKAFFNSFKNGNMKIYNAGYTKDALTISLDAKGRSTRKRRTQQIKWETLKDGDSYSDTKLKNALKNTIEEIERQYFGKDNNESTDS